MLSLNPFKEQTKTLVTAGGLFAVAAYIAAQMLSDIASNKIGSLAGLAIDLGTFIYPITFTLRDVVHKELGRKNARLIIVAAGVINVLMAAYLYFTAVFPSDASFAYHDAFAAIFAVTPRIVIASIVAEIAAELIDTELYHLWVTRVTARHQWSRVLVSNSVSVPVDSAIFALGAFAFYLPWEAVLGIFITNIVIKYIVTVISIPLIYLVPEKKKTEAGEAGEEVEGGKRRPRTKKMKN